MKFVWTVAGDDPDFAIGDQYEINGYYMPMFDPLTTKSFLDNEIKARGHVAGTYMVTNWPQFTGKTPAEIAYIVSTEYKRLQVAGLRVQFDAEEHDPTKIITIFEEWRKLHPTINTSWTFEPMQGGWMGNPCPAEPSDFVKRILACRVRVVPQLYYGNMTPANEGHVVHDIARRGFPTSIISPFYDAAALPVWWDGFAFTMGRLEMT